MDQTPLDKNICISVPHLSPFDGNSSADDSAAPQTSTLCGEAAAIYARGHKSVAQLFTGTGTGSGFFIGDGSELITNYHVVQNETKPITVETTSGQRYLAKIEDVDDVNDLAVLKLENGARVKDTLDLSKTPLATMAPVYALGHPEGTEKLVISPGSVENFGSAAALSNRYSGGSGDLNPFRHMVENLPFSWADKLKQRSNADEILTSTNIKPGNSGGPLLDSDGAVAGVVNATAKPGSNMPDGGWAIPADKVSALVSRDKPTYTFDYKSGSNFSTAPMSTSLYDAGQIGMGYAFPGFTAVALGATSALNLFDDASKLLSARMWQTEEKNDLPYYISKTAADASMVFAGLILFKSPTVSRFALGAGLGMEVAGDSMPRSERVVSAQDKDGNQPLFWSGD